MQTAMKETEERELICLAYPTITMAYDVVTCETKLFRNYSRGWPQLMNALHLQHVRCR